MEKYVGMSAEFIDNINTKKNDMHDAHSHDYYEIYYFLGSEMTFFMDGMPILLGNQDLLLVNKHIFHRTQYSGDVSNKQFVNMSFTEGFMHSYFDMETIDELLTMFETPLLTCSQNPVSAHLDNLIRLTCNSYEQKDKYNLLRASHNLCMVLIELLQNAKHFEYVPFTHGLSSDKLLISKVAQYINENYSEKISLTSIANQFFISKYYLSRVFKRTFGVSITEFVNRKRADEAAYFLENSDKSISDIATMMGFSNQSYFIESFKKYHGTTPKHYRVKQSDIKNSDTGQEIFT